MTYSVHSHIARAKNRANQIRSRFGEVEFQNHLLIEFIKDDFGPDGQLIRKKTFYLLPRPKVRLLSQKELQYSYAAETSSIELQTGDLLVEVPYLLEGSEQDEPILTGGYSFGLEARLFKVQDISTERDRLQRNFYLLPITYNIQEELIILPPPIEPEPELNVFVLDLGDGLTLLELGDEIANLTNASSPEEIAREMSSGVWESQSVPWQSNTNPWITNDSIYKRWRAIHSSTDFLRDFNNALYYRTQDLEMIPDSMLKVYPKFNLIQLEPKHSQIKLILRSSSNKK